MIDRWLRKSEFGTIVCKQYMMAYTIYYRDKAHLCTWSMDPIEYQELLVHSVTSLRARTK